MTHIKAEHYGGESDRSSFNALATSAEGFGSKRRSLAATNETLQIDYSVLAVLVMTLGLIMIVEVVRHRLDYAAKNRPFFKNLLDGVYTECTCVYACQLPATLT
jgi:hypothetical protein